MIIHLLLLAQWVGTVWSYDIKLFAGGCRTTPVAPHYSKMKCSVVMGCTLQCKPGYAFPRRFTGSSMNIEMKCEHGRWNDRFKQLAPGENLPACEPVCVSRCLNDGICIAPNQCLCKDTFEGATCQLDKNKPCEEAPLHLPQNAVASCSQYLCNITCKDNHEFPHGKSDIQLKCQDGDWVYPDAVHGNPNCQPKCDPPCQNGGICLSLNQCHCGVDYRGHHCEFVGSTCKQDMLDFNGESYCVGGRLSYECRLSCPPGIEFEYPPEEVYSCSYERGVFTPSTTPQCQYFGNSEWEQYLSLKNKSMNLKNRNDDPDSFAGYFSVYDNNDLSWLSNTVFDNSTISEPKASTCMIWSFSHIRSFDGVVFSVESMRSHLLVDNESSIKIYIDENMHLVFVTQSKTYTLETTYEPPVLRSEGQIISIPGANHGLLTEMVGDRQIFIYLYGLGIKIVWSKGGTIMINADDKLWNCTKGFCGNMNGNIMDDFMTASGNMASSVSMLSNSWNTGDDNELFEEPSVYGRSDATTEGNHPCMISSELANKSTQFCGKLLKEPNLKPCHQIFNSYSFYQTCKWDYCVGNEEQACKSMEIFVSWCLNSGLQVINNGWRAPDLCPYTCPEGLEYRLCGSGDSVTCDDIAKFSDENHRNDAKIVEDVDICIEGCYCPSGTFLHEGKCITRDQCPCTFNGVKFQSGKIVKQECNECLCESGLWHCSEQLCGRRCSIIGNNHVTTFDGKTYSFTGQGRYTALKSDDVIIQVQNVQCATSASQTFGYSVSSTIKAKAQAQVTIYAFAHKIVLKEGYNIVVDNQEINTIPYMVTIIDQFHVVISQGSSLYLRVSLPDGLDILWDGKSILYIDAPPEMTGFLTGLCGNFNRIQKDDFGTPEGEIENTPYTFALSWRDNTCATPPIVHTTDICEFNTALRYQAESFCHILKSDMFKVCHWAIPPEPFIKSCIADVCTSEETQWAKGACPILSHYATICTAKGIHIKSWRKRVSQCSLYCDHGQQYSLCQSGCGRTCRDISTNPKCTRSNNCIEGCACPQGRSLDDHGKCIPVSDCPCIDPVTNTSIPAGTIKYQSENVGTEHCTCIRAKWNCRPLQNEDERAELLSRTQVTCDIQRNQILDECPHNEPITCANMHEISSKFKKPVNNKCEQPRCVCQEGYVHAVANSTLCIKKEQCPCHHAGKSYLDGERIKQDCNTCQCAAGRWVCTLRVCPSVCTAWGDSHYKTFDGKIFDFHGSCEYILAKGGSDNDSFVIKIQNVPCGASDVTCSKTISLKIGGKIAEKVLLSKNKPIPRNGDFQRIVVRKVGLYVFIDVYDLGLTIQWDGANRIYIRVRPTWKGHMQGLCGNANDDEEDDFRRPSGMIEPSAVIFGDSWKVHKYCPGGSGQKNTCELNPRRRIWATSKCSVMKSDIFKACHSGVDLEPWYERCVLDACGCNVGGDCECLCTAVAAYAHECSSVGVPIRWRTQELCPMQCPYQSNYESCIETCPPKTCTNIFYYKSISMSCGDESCVEGCEPELCDEPGEIYLGDNDFKCVGTQSCPKVECIVENGIQYYEGDSMTSDDCHNCTCSRSRKRCIYSESELCSIIIEGSSTTPYFISTTAATKIFDLDNTTTLSCFDGYSSWINENTPSVSNPNDIESIQDFRNASKDRSLGYCNQSSMVDIECRNAQSQVTGGVLSTDEFSVECDLKKGVVCTVSSPGAVCEDFEYRVKCSCKITDVNVTVSSCDPDDANLRPVEGDCNMFEQCVRGPLGTLPRYTERSCGEGLLFNPESLSCDSPQNVIPIRPECEGGLVVTLAPAFSTSTTTTPHVCDQDPSAPNVPHETDCSLFYHCYNDGPNGTRRPELKACGPGTLYNTAYMVCDFPRNVYLYRKECKEEGYESTTHGYIETTTSGYIVPYACSKSNVYSIIDDPIDRVPDSAFVGSSYTPYGRPEYSRMLYIMSDNYGGIFTKTNSFNISSVVVKNFEDDMAAGYGIPPKKSGGHFYLSICGVLGCCDTGILHDNIRNWDNDLNFRTSEIGECIDYDIGQDGNDIEIKIKHDGLVETRIDSLEIKGGENNQTFHCEINVVFYDDDTHSFTCTLKGNKRPSGGLNKGCWSPRGNSKKQYLQIQLNAPREIYGIILRGNNQGDYVKSYYVTYSTNGHSFSYIEDHQGYKRILYGPSDSVSSSKQFFDYPIRAKTIRIIPQSWNGDICIKLDLLGCLEATISPSTTPLTRCMDTMGMSNGHLSMNNVYVSSVWNGDKKHFGKKHLPITSDSAWKPAIHDNYQYVLIDLTDARKLSGIVTKGHGHSWISSFMIEHSLNGHQWHKIVHNNGTTTIFKGNDDGVGVENHFFPHLIQTRYVKLLPMSWPKGGIALKFELLGCFEPYILTTTIPTISTTGESLPGSRNCQPCPNLPEENIVCVTACRNGTLWNGTACVFESECPCFDGSMQYSPGSVFTNQNCEDCLCMAGGSLQCSPKVCPTCVEIDEYAFLTPACGCICKKCPEGHRVCPTSNTCIPESSWCDGIQNCEDDEVNCEGSSSTALPVVCPPDPVCPPGSQLKPTEIEIPIGCIISKCTCLPPSCPPGYKVQYNTSNSENRSIDRPLKFTQGYTLDENDLQEGFACANYTCVKEVTISICSVRGSGIRTLDGFEYDFPICHHILATNTSERWSVIAHKECKFFGSCKKSVEIIHGNDRIIFGQDMIVTFNGVRYTPLQATKLNSHFKLRLIGDMTYLFLSKKYPFAVQWTKSGNIDVTADSSAHDEVVGLCGLFNGDSSDDKTKPDGSEATSIEEFGNSWNVIGSPDCTATVCTYEQQRRAKDICNSLKYPPFNKCGHVVDYRKSSHECMEKACECLQNNYDDTRTCRCNAQTDYVTECLSQDPLIDLSNWRLHHFCPSNCPHGKVMRDCHPTGCQTSCGDIAQREICENMESDDTLCFSGCFCSEGHVLSEDGGRCIPKEKCQDCVCQGLGQSTYVSFDKKEFKFPGNCSYVAARHNQGDFEVQITNMECHDNWHAYCTVSITIQTSDRKLIIDKNDKSPEKATLKLNGTDTAPSVNHISDWFQSVLTPSGNVRIYVAEFNLKVVFMVKEGGFTIKFSSFIYGGKTSGLCGNCDGDQLNDFTLRNSSVTTNAVDFGNDWATKLCLKPENDTLTIPCLNGSQKVECDKLTQESFSSCNPLISPDPFIKRCKDAFCKRENYTVCSAMEEYSAACLTEAGMCLEWRQRENCQPSVVCEDGEIYKECSEHCDDTCDDVASESMDLSIYARNVFNLCGDAIESEGCFCPEDQVRDKDDKCINSTQCITCIDSRGNTRHLDEIWAFTECESCICTATGANCDVIQCVNLTCPLGQMIQFTTVPGQCCPSQACVLANPRNCSSTPMPQCADNTILKQVEVEDQPCPRYVCECVEREDCPPLEGDEDSLVEGEKLVIVDNGCCERYVVECDIELCNGPPPCPKFYILNSTPGKCCPIYTCVPPTGCVDSKFDVLREINETWNDGPCMHCQCVESMDNRSMIICTEEKCDRFEEAFLQDQEDFVVVNITSPDECCIAWNRTACKVNGRVFEIGESMNDVINGQCNTYNCNITGGVIRKLLVGSAICATDCLPGYRLEDPLPGECCKTCIPFACFSDGELLEVNTTVTNGCVTRTCVNTNGSFVLTEKSKSCKDISGCPQRFRQLDESGCCEMCSSDAIFNTDCLPLPFNDTIGLVQENHPEFGHCKNSFPIDGFQQCDGRCKSETIYISVLESHISNCTCCQALEERTVSVELFCASGDNYVKEIKVPETCACLKCSSSEETHESNTTLFNNSTAEPITATTVNHYESSSFSGNQGGYGANGYSSNQDVIQDGYYVTPKYNKGGEMDYYDFMDAIKNIPKDQRYSTSYGQRKQSGGDDYDIDHILNTNPASDYGYEDFEVDKK